MQKLWTYCYKTSRKRIVNHGLKGKTMIKFEDFFKVDYPNETKVKFNMNAANKNEPAWDFLKCEDGSSNYQRWINMNAHKRKQANNNLNNAKYLLAFAQYYPLGQNYYIFGGMYKVDIIDPNITDGLGYKLTLMGNFSEYRKRLIIKLKSPIGRNIYNKRYCSVQKDLDPELYEILPTQAIEDFPGYNNVLLTHKQLRYIYEKEAPEWKRQLSSIKGVYCITDISNGKIYVGSAYGNCAGIWQRWSAYANPKNLAGGNKDFEEIKIKNPEYIINNFTYSILEILDPKTSDDEVIRKENFWKNVLKTKQFGMNNN